MFDGRHSASASSSRLRGGSEMISPRINRIDSGGGGGATSSNECTDLLREEECSRDRCSFESTSIDRHTYNITIPFCKRKILRSNASLRAVTSSFILSGAVTNRNEIQLSRRDSNKINILIYLSSQS